MYEEGEIIMENPRDETLTKINNLAGLCKSMIRESSLPSRKGVYWIGEFEVTFQRSRSTSDDDLILSDRIFRFKLIMNGWIFGE